MRSQFENDATLEINVFPYLVRCFFRSSSALCQDPRITRAYTAQNTKKMRTSRLSRSALMYSIPARCGTDTAGQGAFEPPPANSSSENRILRPGREKNSRPNPPKKNDSIYWYIFQGGVGGITVVRIVFLSGSGSLARVSPLFLHGLKLLLRYGLERPAIT